MRWGGRSFDPWTDYQDAWSVEIGPPGCGGGDPTHDTAPTMDPCVSSTRQQYHVLKEHNEEDPYHEFMTPM